MLQIKQNPEKFKEMYAKFEEKSRLQLHKYGRFVDEVFGNVVHPSRPAYAHLAPGGGALQWDYYSGRKNAGLKLSGQGDTYNDDSLIFHSDRNVLGGFN